MSKKVLIFSLAYYPKHVGGAEVAIKEITDRISPEDIEFHMITLRFDSTLPKVEKVGNILVHRIGFSKKDPSAEEMKTFPLHLNKFLFQFSAFLKARKLHAIHKYDGLWGMMAHSTATPLGLCSMFGPKVPFVLTLQEGDDLKKIEKKARPVWPLFKRAFTHANVIQVISNYLASWATRMGATCPVEVIPNGVDIEKFSKQFNDRDPISIIFTKQHKKEGDVWLITTSRLVHKNGVDDVLHALTFLPKHTKFLIVGKGEEEQVLKKLVTEKGLQERVVFYGHVDYNDISKFLQECDIFIRPSRTEGMGNSFIEAMATGLPVIATQEGGIADFLFDAEKNQNTPTTGWAVDKNSPKQIAKAVQDIENNPEKVKVVVQNAKTFIKGKGYNCRTHEKGCVFKGVGTFPVSVGTFPVKD